MFHDSKSLRFSVMRPFVVEEVEDLVTVEELCGSRIDEGSGSESAVAIPGSPGDQGVHVWAPLEPVFHQGSIGRQAAWAPDGRTIAYVGAGGIWVVQR